MILTISSFDMNTKKLDIANYNPGKPLVIAMSGGVDSSVAAVLLKDAGYECSALFMKSWDEKNPGGSCRWEDDVTDALHICEKLKIEINTVDLTEEYETQVFKDFIKSYSQGFTPNPDIVCNKKIKFEVFAQLARKIGAKKIATGHYANIETTNSSIRLKKGKDPEKDQSYFLSGLNQEQLQFSMFPLGKMKKKEVREIAKRYNLVNSEKKSTSGICFIEQKSFRDFITNYIQDKPGDIQTLDEVVVGEHRGLHFYTIGQRKGLRIGGMRNSEDLPWFVVNKDLKQNILYVAQGEDHPALLSNKLIASNAFWIEGESPNFPLFCSAKIRYRQKDQDCQIGLNEDGKLFVTFKNPQRAIAPGQTIVFYKGDLCLGNAIIETNCNFNYFY